jgi:hypothetical protein
MFVGKQELPTNRVAATVRRQRRLFMMSLDIDFVLLF